MNSAEKLIEVRVKNEILVNYIKQEIKDREERSYSYLDTDEIKNLLTVMGYYAEDVKIEPGTVTEALTDWAPTNPATDVMDEEF